MKPQGFIPPTASPSAHEGADLHVPKIVRVVAILGVTLAASIVVLIFFFRHMEKEYPNRTSEAAPEVGASELPPVPRVEAYPFRDLQAVRKVEDSHLDHYGWIDRPHGVAQIPVERAMVLWTKNYSTTPQPTTVPATTVPATKAAPTPGTTELQMRQRKATEAPHAP